MSKLQIFKETSGKNLPYTNWLGVQELSKCSKAASDLYARVLLQQRLIDSNVHVAVRQICTKKQRKYEFILDGPFPLDGVPWVILAKLVTDFKDKVIARVVYDHA